MAREEMIPNLLLRLMVSAILLILAAVPSRAFEIQEVTSPGGIKAWLVEDKSIPLIALNFSFRAGSASDPAGKSGVANFLTGMMDEGAGDLDSADFQKLRDDLSFRMSFSSGLDFFEGSFQTLSRHRDASFDLLRQAITAPRFDALPLDRVRQQFLLSVKDRGDDPERLAFSAWMELALPGDPYALDKTGTGQTVAAITASDLSDAHRRIFGRKTLQVGVVGDIGAAELAALLDRVFGALPEGHAQSLPVPEPVSAGPPVKIIPRDIPQSIVVFGHEGIKRDDPDFIPAYVMSEILGGGGFGSRLTEEIREKRGLTYGVSAGFSPLQRLGLFIGSLSTRNDRAGEALGVAREVMERMAEDGPTQQELDEAKTYLTGSYALRFTGNDAIASLLLALQQQGMGIGYIEKRNSLVEAVTLDQVKAQAKRLLHPDRLIVTIVGKPEGVN